MNDKQQSKGFVMHNALTCTDILEMNADDVIWEAGHGDGCIQAKVEDVIEAREIELEDDKDEICYANSGGDVYFAAEDEAWYFSAMYDFTSMLDESSITYETTSSGIDIIDTKEWRECEGKITFTLKQIIDFNDNFDTYIALHKKLLQ